jgi:outer membrane lipoprotein SlyB
MRKYLIITISCFAFLSACTSSGEIHNSSRNQMITTFYATVESTQEVEFESHVEEGAAIGAIDGFLSNAYGDSKDRLFGAMWGAFFGALVTSIIEGDTDGYQYQLEDLYGDLHTVILEDNKASLGDCVLVTVSGVVDITLVSDDYCYE